MLCFRLLAPPVLIAGVGIIAGSASAACVSISKPADLEKVRKNLQGDYCLAADLDMSGVANFTPIGLPEFSPFVGTFDGRGHVIRNLTVKSEWHAGFFALVGDGFHRPVIKNLGLVNVNVVSTGDTSVSEVGGLAGTLNFKASIVDSYVTGKVSGENTLVGGLVGEQEGGTILRSHSAAAVHGGSAGGLVGDQESGSGAIIIQSYATGKVSGRGNIGGLVGNSRGTLLQSFASGPVIVPDGAQNVAGGLTGAYYGDSALQAQDCSKGPLKQVFATGPIIFNAKGDIYSHAGGLSGFVWDYCGYAQQDYAAGRVTLAHPKTTNAGGLVGECVACDSMVLKALYWDKETVGLKLSQMGQGVTTTQLQDALPKGFDPAIWDITPGVTFPFLALDGLDFWSPLAITVVGPKVFTFLPISQLEPSEYGISVNHAKAAGLAAVYTILARGIGITEGNIGLEESTIDQFWDDAAQKASFTGPLTEHASLGSFRKITGSTPLGSSNVITPLRSHKPVILRGRAGKKIYWMLATSFMVDSTGALKEVIADDPWSGRQVHIDPVTKHVAKPSGVAPPDFTVDGFEVVTLK